MVDVSIFIDLFQKKRTSDNSVMQTLRRHAIIWTGDEMKTILIVEDDKTIVMGLEYSLQQEGYDVICCYNAKEANEAVREQAFDLALLDLSLPDGSGYDICRLIRSGSETPVVFLTARDEEVNVVMGLDMGADDYVTKPFRVRELMSRIRGVLRRAEKTDECGRDELRMGRLVINTRQARVTKDGEELLLTALEYRLLLTFAAHPGQVLTRTQLLEGIWDIAGDFVSDNTLSVYVRRLREKIEDDPNTPALIHTVRGLGYRAGDGHAAQ
jgi:DNA-binding response OmpR family regulator